MAYRFDSVSCQAEEARQPERDLPIAILLSLAVSTALYVTVSLVITGMVNYKDIDVTAPLSTAFSQRGYHWAAYIVGKMKRRHPSELCVSLQSSVALFSSSSWRRGWHDLRSTRQFDGSTPHLPCHGS
jgi:amino acid transporter